MGDDDALSEVTVVESWASSPPAPRTRREAPRQHVVQVRAAAAQPAVPATTAPIFRYRKTPLVLVLIYLTTLIVPWMLICILARRPLSASSYHEPHPTRDINSAPYIFARALSTVNGVLAIPIISALLASAAVVYVTRRKASQKLSVAQLFALADHGWASVLLLWPINWKKQQITKTSSFLLLGACLIFLGAVLQPLTFILVDTEQIAVINLADEPLVGSQLGLQYPIAMDADPGGMELLAHDLVIQSVMGRLATVKDYADQPNMWFESFNKDNDDNEVYGHNLARAFDDRDHLTSIFVSALRNGTHTGVLREHAVRLNSSVHCESIAADEFPSLCNGPRPLVVQVEHKNVTLAVCAPGSTTQFPFTLSRNRQDIVEQLFIKASSSSLSSGGMYCTATTTRGYFELGNARNNYRYGPLLDRWPDAATIGREFHDDVRMTETADPVSSDDFKQPGNYPFSRGFPPQPSSAGPLMVAAEALFGNFSMLHFLSDKTLNLTSAQTMLAMCQHGNPPFTRLGLSPVGQFGFDSGCANIAAWLQGFAEYSPADPEVLIDGFLRSYIDPFVSERSAQITEYLLSIAMFCANEVVLTETAKTSRGLHPPRAIYFSPGKLVLKPKMDKIRLIVLSALIGLQVFGVAALTWYIYSMPTWVPSLDAVTLARIGKGMDEDVLPPLGSLTKEMERRLGGVDGLVGEMLSPTGRRRTNGFVRGEGEVDGDGVHVLHTLDTNGLETDNGRARLVLGRGGQGLVTKRFARLHRRR